MVMAGDTDADIVERLLGEFDPRLSLAEISGVVHQCRQQLHGQGTSLGALPELLERLARERLNALVIARATDA